MLGRVHSRQQKEKGGTQHLIVWALELRPIGQQQVLITRRIDKSPEIPK